MHDGSCGFGAKSGLKANNLYWGFLIFSCYKVQRTFLSCGNLADFVFYILKFCALQDQSSEEFLASLCPKQLPDHENKLPFLLTERGFFLVSSPKELEPEGGT